MQDFDLNDVLRYAENPSSFRANSVAEASKSATEEQIEGRLSKHVLLARQLYLLAHPKDSQNQQCCRRSPMARAAVPCIHSIMFRQTPLLTSARYSSLHVSLMENASQLRKCVYTEMGKVTNLDSDSHVLRDILRESILHGPGFVSLSMQIQIILEASDVVRRLRKSCSLENNLRFNITSLLIPAKLDLRLAMNDRQAMGFILVSNIFMARGVNILDFDHMLDAVTIGVLGFYLAAEHAAFVSDNRKNKTRYLPFEHPSTQLSCWFLFSFIIGIFGHSFAVIHSLPLYSLRKHAHYLEDVRRDLSNKLPKFHSSREAYLKDFNDLVSKYIALVYVSQTSPRIAPSTLKQLDDLYSKILPFYRLMQIDLLLTAFHIATVDLTADLSSNSCILSDLGLHVNESMQISHVSPESMSPLAYMYYALKTDTAKDELALNALLSDMMIGKIPVELQLQFARKFVDRQPTSAAAAALSAVIYLGVCPPPTILGASLYRKIFTLVSQQQQLGDLIQALVLTALRKIDEFVAKKGGENNSTLKLAYLSKAYALNNGIMPLQYPVTQLNNLSKLVQSSDLVGAEIDFVAVQNNIMSLLMFIVEYHQSWAYEVVDQIATGRQQTISDRTRLFLTRNNTLRFDIEHNMPDVFAKVWNKPDIMESLGSGNSKVSLVKGIVDDYFSKVIRQPEQASSVLDFLSALKTDASATELLANLRAFLFVTKAPTGDVLGYLLKQRFMSTLCPKEVYIYIIQKIIVIETPTRAREITSDAAMGHSDTKAILFGVCTVSSGILLLMEEYTILANGEKFVEELKSGKSLADIIDMSTLSSAGIDLILTITASTNSFKTILDEVFQIFELCPNFNDEFIRYIVQRLLIHLWAERKLQTSRIMFLHDSLPYDSPSARRRILGGEESLAIAANNIEKGSELLDFQAMVVTMLMRFQLRRRDVLNAVTEILEFWDFISLNDRLSLQLYLLSYLSENFSLWIVVLPQLLQLCRLLASVGDFESCIILAERISSNKWNAVKGDVHVDIMHRYFGMMRGLTDSELSNQVAGRVSFEIAEYCIVELVNRAIFVGLEIAHNPPLQALVRCVRLSPELLEIAVDVARSGVHLPPRVSKNNENNKGVKPIRSDIRGAYIANTLIDLGFPYKRISGKARNFYLNKQARGTLRWLSSKMAMPSSVEGGGLSFSAQDVHLDAFQV